MKPSVILKDVLDLFEDPSKWTKGVWALDKKRNVVASTSRNAVCWCLEGAIFHCTKEGEFPLTDASQVFSVLSKCIPKKYYKSIAKANDADSTKITTVRTWLKKAIILAKSEGK